MKSLLLSALLLTAGASLFSLPGCETHDHDRISYDHDHPDYDHHDVDRDHHEEIRHDEYHAEEH